MTLPISLTPAIPASYKAYVYESNGKMKDVLKLKDVPTEELPSTHVRIKVHHAALNPVDAFMADTLGKQLNVGTPSEEKPFRTGIDVAGVVVEVGSDVAGKFQIGDEVYAMLAILKVQGSLAEYVIADGSVVGHKAKNLTWEQAAAVPCVSLTTYHSLVDIAKLQPGERLLVLGGSSSTGMFGIQYAKMIGVHVVATTSTKNVEFVKSLGADQVIDYTKDKWSEVLVAHSVDVVYDCVGEKNCWSDGSQVVLKKNTGRFASIMGAQHEATESPIGASFHNVFTFGSADSLNNITKFIEEGKIKPIVHSTFTFDKVVDGFELLMSGKVVGKIVISVQ